MSQEKKRSLLVQLKDVKQKLDEFNASPEKPRKTKNYALKKVEQPPSDKE